MNRHKPRPSDGMYDCRTCRFEPQGTDCPGCTPEAILYTQDTDACPAWEPNAAAAVVEGEEGGT